MRPVYVTGHKNPDTDSIISAIAYSEYKKQKNNLECIPSRIGPVSSDTEWLLERFGFEDPLHIYTAKSTVREIDFDKAILIKKEMTIKEALDKILDIETKTAYVADSKRRLLGMITQSLITGLWLESDRRLRKIYKTITLKNMCKVLSCKIVVKPVEFRNNGIIHLTPREDVEYEENSIVITQVTRKIINAIKSKVGAVIVINSTEVTKEMIDLALEYDVALLSSSSNSLTIARNLPLTPTVEHIMTTADNIISIKDSSTTDEAIERIVNSRFRSYPILDGHGCIIGALARYHLLTYKKKKLILVDHNEKKQSIDDIEHGEVIEIVDHHRLGGFESDNPINITTMIVGATCTIIANKFMEDNLNLTKPMAGLLLGGIVADTMNFKSPTTTKLDVETAKKLEAMTGEKSDELMAGIIGASASLLNRRANEIVNADFKEYIVKGEKVGLAQAICKSFEEYKGIRTPIGEYIDEQIRTGGYSLFAIMLTDPLGSGSYVIYRGKRSSAIDKSFPNKDINNFVNHLVSRKKQLLPSIITNFGE